MNCDLFLTKLLEVLDTVEAEGRQRLEDSFIVHANPDLDREDMDAAFDLQRDQWREYRERVHAALAQASSEATPVAVVQNFCRLMADGQ
jgi:hypothetical protein